LFDGQLSIQSQGRFAPLSGVCPVLEHEHLAACRGDLAQEARNQGIAQFDGLSLGLCRIDCGLGEFDFRHDDSSEDPISRSLLGAKRVEAGSGFRKHRHMMNLPKLLINLLYRATA
jgi:hypothetical protein